MTPRAPGVCKSLAVWQCRPNDHNLSLVPPGLLGVEYSSGARLDPPMSQGASGLNPKIGTRLDRLCSTRDYVHASRAGRLWLVSSRRTSQPVACCDAGGFAITAPHESLTLGGYLVLAYGRIKGDEVTEREEIILQEITRRYLTSGDFNGTPLYYLAKELNIPWEDFIQEVIKLIQKNKIRIIFSDTDVNPHIIRLGVEPASIQLEKLPSADVHACGYPAPEHLASVVNPHDFEGRPYTLCLALGEPQLSYKAFDLSVLEFYRNDPRYEYTTDDIHGQIGLTNEYFESSQIPESDRVFLETFGFCYDEDLNRAVAVYVRYISDLSPEHQQIWKAKELQGTYRLHPDYYRNTIVGDWGERIPIFGAFIMELQIINQMSIAMGRPPLFRIDFTQQKRPREFSFLVRPTLKEYNDFVLLLDKLLSTTLTKIFS